MQAVEPPQREGLTRLVAEQRAHRAKVGADTLTLWHEIEELGLTRYFAELDVKGYTVIPPERSGAGPFLGRLREAIMNVVERRSGNRPDLERDVHGHAYSALGSIWSYLLFEEDVFQDALMNPVNLCLVTYMLGRSAVLSTMQAQLKGPGNDDLPLHSDNLIFSAPFSAHYQFCNIVINFTPYTPDDGPICFVPGSHKLYRQPNPGEGLDQRVGIEAAPGSLIAFTGHTWHGAFARKNPGLRVGLLQQFVRPQTRTFEPYREDVSDEMLDRHPPRFARLMGKHINHGWRREGPQNTDYAYNMGAHAYD